MTLEEFEAQLKKLLREALRSNSTEEVYSLAEGVLSLPLDEEKEDE